MAGYGLGFAGFREHEELRQNGYRFQVDAECPQNLENGRKKVELGHYLILWISLVIAVCSQKRITSGLIDMLWMCRIFPGTHLDNRKLVIDDQCQQNTRSDQKFNAKRIVITIISGFELLEHQEDGCVRSRDEDNLKKMYVCM